MEVDQSAGMVELSWLSLSTRADRFVRAAMLGIGPLRLLCSCQQLHLLAQTCKPFADKVNLGLIVVGRRNGIAACIWMRKYVQAAHTRLSSFSAVRFEKVPTGIRPLSRLCPKRRTER